MKPLPHWPKDSPKINRYCFSPPSGQGAAETINLSCLSLFCQTANKFWSRSWLTLFHPIQWQKTFSIINILEPFSSPPFSLFPTLVWCREKWPKQKFTEQRFEVDTLIKMMIALEADVVWSIASVRLVRFVWVEQMLSSTMFKYSPSICSSSIFSTNLPWSIVIWAICLLSFSKIYLCLGQGALH